MGGGKEATGLVTRFTRAKTAAPVNYPVPLQLFSEIDLAKILANTWFNDFNHELLSYQLDEARIEARLQPFEHRLINPVANNGVSRDDVVALWDYLNGSFRKSVEKLEHGYWPRVLQLAPTLMPAERAELFSLLWGEQTELTEIYRNLATSLARLDHAKTVYAPLDCLLNQSNGSVSIMNVDSLGLLGSVEDRTVEICFLGADGRHMPASIAQAQLAALTTELIFPMVEGRRVAWWNRWIYSISPATEVASRLVNWKRQPAQVVVLFLSYCYVARSRICSSVIPIIRR